MIKNPSEKNPSRSKLSSFRTKTVVLAIAAGVVLAGCQTTNPYTRESEVNKTTKGAGIGAAAGLATSIIIGGDRKRLLIGTGIGALAGGLIGNYMDQQDAKLRAQLQGTGVSVTRVGDQLILNMPGNVTFASNSSDISSSFYDVLDSVALVLNEFDQTYVDVVGHTDSTGSMELNQRLSRERAASVARYLQSQKVQSARIVTRGVGPTQPIATNDTPEGRALNRRVEIVLTPLT
jgi:outer membrane protein OmpA-like peptidoglycan-associated protein